MYGGRVLHQPSFLWVQIVLPFSPTSLLADLIQWFLNKNEKKLAQLFDFTFRYIDDVLFTK